MDTMTLREVCDTFGVSRRAIQGYEKNGLVLPFGKNERGHLLYDGEAQERIKQIRMFQQIGFTLKEIQEIIDAPKEARKRALEKQLDRLEEEKEQMEALIKEVRSIIEEN